MPGGYVVYLRLSGPNQVFKVEQPVSDVPYYVGDDQSPDYALQLPDAAGMERGPCSQVYMVWFARYSALTGST